jgi:hypothetical protein
VKPAVTLDKVVMNFGGYPVEPNTYAHILGDLGIGVYWDEQRHAAGLG